MRADLTVPVGPRDHVLGDRAAPVVIVEYGDYQCPHCGRAYPIVKQLQRHFGDTLAFGFRNFPLTEMHPDALRAAETAEWAGLSRRFWRMHDYLFEHQQELGRLQLADAAEGLGFDARQLQLAWDDHALRSRVVEDVASGTASGVTGTPTFFINGVRHDGAWSLDALIAAVHAADHRRRLSFDVTF